MAEYKVVDAEQLESDLTVVADAIREKGGTSEQLAFPNGMADAVRGIQSGGTFGVDWLQYANNMKQVFSNSIFPEGSEVSLCLDNATDISQLFQGAIGVTKITLTASESENTINMGSTFYGSENSTLETIDLSGLKKKPHNISHCFRACRNLKYIFGELDFSAVTSSTYIGSVFLYCANLEEVRVKKGTLSISIQINAPQNLSDASIQSIIDGLADLTGSTAQTITFHADVKAKLTEEQIATITSKNWTLA